MKRNFKTLLLIIAPILVLLFTLSAVPYFPQSLAIAETSSNIDYSATVPYETMTAGPEGSLVTTQTAFMPESSLSLTGSVIGGLSSPEDMLVEEKDGKTTVYIADTGNGRVVVTDLNGANAVEVGKDILKQPTGLALNDDYLFVCDKGNKLIYLFDKTDYSLVKELDKPTNPLVGANTPYTPTKMTVDSRGNLFVVSEGCVSGVMQMNIDGEFIGYVGANETNKTLVSILQNLFFSEAQKNTFLATPRSPTNVAIDGRGLVYTVTNNAVSNTIKKLNTLGNSIMSPNVNYLATTAVCIDNSENIYSIQTDGYVTIFDSEGNLLFRFGGSDSLERFGSLSSPVAVSALSDGRILVLDSKYAMAIIYSRTEFASLVFSAVDYYKDGRYIDGEELWQEVLRHNSSFILSYKALARANMKKNNYGLALQQFKYAEDREGYSDAFWEIRNEWLENNLLWVFCVIIAIIVIVVVLKFIDKKKPALLAPVKTGLSKVNDVHVKHVYPFREIKHMGRFCKATQDAVYEVKYHNAASIWTAGVLFLWFIILQILSVVITGYLFNSSTVYNTNGWNVVLTTTGVLLLLILCNYFVSTVTDGEGKLKYCFISFIYALTPYLIMALPLAILSNALTFNESFVYTFLQIVMYGWSAICVFRAIMELHDYSIGKTIKNIILTVFAFAMVLLFFVVLRMLFAQIFGYFGAIFAEVIR